jgi:hypothetical protein
MSDGYEYVCEKPTNHISVHKLKLASSSGWPYWALPSAALASLAAALYTAAGSSPMVVILTAVLLLVSIVYLAAMRSQVLEGKLIITYTHTKRVNL